MRPSPRSSNGFLQDYQSPTPSGTPAKPLRRWEWRTCGGIIHRDLKPQNLMIRQDGKMFVMDFGLVRIETEESISLPGLIMGTPSYMSPEQVRGERHIQPATDIYSLGVILYELLTGLTPFVANTREELFRKIAIEKPIPPSVHRPGIDHRLDAICLKSMAKFPKDRFTSMEEMVKAIDLATQAPPSGPFIPVPPDDEEMHSSSRSGSTIRRQKAIGHRVSLTIALGVLLLSCGAWALANVGRRAGCESGGSSKSAASAGQES